MRLYTASEMRALEAEADAQGLPYAEMMENAGRGVAEVVLGRLEDPSGHKVVVLAGAGNNGGDGLVAAHYLANAGLAVTVYLTRPADEADPKVKRLRAHMLLIADAVNDQRGRVLNNLLQSSTVIVDALVGTGARLPLGGVPAEILHALTRVLDQRHTRPVVVAVDCPSGLDCDTGSVDPAAVPADLTVTFAGPKRGHLAFPGAEVVGDLVTVDIGIPPALAGQRGIALITPDWVAAHRPARPRDSHKGTYGTVTVLGGCLAYPGAPLLAARASYRVGAGLVRLAVPRTIWGALVPGLAEAIWCPLTDEVGAIAAEATADLGPVLPDTDALVLGPGLGRAAATVRFVARLLDQPEAAARSLGFGRGAPAVPDAVPLPRRVVVDADGLRALADLDAWPARLPAESVLTPHPGEFAALTGLTTQAVQAARIERASQAAKDWGHVVVLKGAYTVIAAPDGRVALLPFATSALAKAGTGDVLSGAIGGLLAQGLAPFEAACVGGGLHGAAAERLAARVGEAGLLASEIAEALTRLDL
jgi:NAD(P)H-hydrate epimerase